MGRPKKEYQPEMLTVTLRFMPYAIEQMRKIMRSIARLKSLPGYVEDAGNMQSDGVRTEPWK